jgi:branched-chain amino acid transport system permease protein
MRGDGELEPTCVSGGTALQLCLDGLAASGVYALVGLGVQVAHAGSGVLHLGIGDAAVAGAIAGAALAGTGAPAWLAAVVALLVAAGLSGAMERLLVRPAAGRVALAVAALVAGGSVLRQAVAATFTQPAYAFPAPHATWHIGDGLLRATDVLTAGVAVAVALSASWLLARTSAGAALRATAGDPAAAESIGVDTRRVRSAAFVAAGLLAGLAALLSAGRIVATPASGVGLGIKGLCAAAAGRLGSPLAVCLGAVLIGGTEAGASFALGGGGEAVTYAVAALALAAGWRARR